MSTYKGILGNEKQKEIEELVILSRFKGLGWRDIEKTLKSSFGLNVSHTTVRSYYINELKGEVLDKAKDQAVVKAFEDIDDDIGGRETEIDEIRLRELERIYNPNGVDPIGSLYSKIIALCEANAKDHIENGARLKTHYVKYLKDIKAVIGSRSK